MSYLLSLALLLLVRVDGFPFTTLFRSTTSVDRSAVLFVSSDSTTTTATDITLTIPRAFEGEVDGGTYPSPLHDIHITSILSDKEVRTCLELATTYAEATGRWERPNQERHASYATCDFAIEECETLDSYLQEIVGFDERIWDVMSRKYGVSYEDMSYLDFFCAHYQAQSDGNSQTMDRLEAHRDGSLLSFTILLSPPDEFEGGGTFFDALRDEEETDVLCTGGVIRPKRAGDVILQSGKLLHGADVVRSGKRTVLVGFLEVGDWRQRPGVLSTACTDWGRMDVAKLRHKRQQKETASEGSKGWFLNNSKYVYDGNKEMGLGRSAIRGFCPAFSTVQRRAEENFQRRKRLEAEDVLLRTILLPEGEGEQMIEIFDGDITIL
jgi:hypothetical protein